MPRISMVPIILIPCGVSCSHPCIHLLELFLDDALEGDGIGGELADTLTQLLDGHLVLVEVEAEQGLVGDVRLLLNVQRAGLGSVELLGDGLGGVEEVLEQVGLRWVLVMSSNRWVALARGIAERTEMVR
jgi:hypothetical protein